MRGRRSYRRELRKILLSRRHFAAGLDPVVAERPLKAIDDRPLDAQAGVAPVVLVLGAAGPLVGDAVAADVADASVDDHLLAMIAIVQSTEVLEAQGVKTLHDDAGVGHEFCDVAAHLATAGGVDEEP